MKKALVLSVDAFFNLLFLRYVDERLNGLEITQCKWWLSKPEMLGEVLLKNSLNTYHRLISIRDKKIR